MTPEERQRQQMIAWYGAAGQAVYAALDALPHGPLCPRCECDRMDCGRRVPDPERHRCLQMYECPRCGWSMVRAVSADYQANCWRITWISPDEVEALCDPAPAATGPSARSA